MHQPRRQRRCGHVVHAPGTGRLTEDGYPVRIPPERRDVVLNPPQRSDLVKDPVVPRRPVRRLFAEQGMRQIPERAHPVVDGHHDRPTPRQCGPVIGAVRPVPDPQATPMNPHQHRQRVSRRGRCPDVQIQAVFGRLLHPCVIERGVRRLGVHLDAGGPGGRGIADPGPFRRRLWRTPAQIAHRRRSERQSAMHPDVGIPVGRHAFRHALSHGDLSCLNDRFRRRRRLGTACGDHDRPAESDCRQ